MKNFFILYVFLFTLILGTDSFSSSKASTFLRDGVGSKEVATGSANTASVEGVNSIYWNPAGLLSMDAYSWKLGSFYSIETEDRYYAFLAIATRTEELGNFGAGLINHGITNIELFDEAGFNKGITSDSEYILCFSYANKINYQIKFGGTLKAHYHDLAGYKGLGYSFDIGFILQPLLDKEIYFGIMLQNLFGEIFWDESKEDILSIYKFGLSIALFEDVVRFNVDMAKEENLENIILKGGVEFKIMQYFFLRAGLDDKYPALGAGIKHEQYQVDYAYNYNKYDIGDLHQISLILMW